MRTLLLTAYDDAMAPIGSLTAPLMQRYADIHGFDFFCSRIFETASQSYWQKVWDIRNLTTIINPARKHYDRVLWLDSDQVITRPGWTPLWEKGFHASLDWGLDANDDTKFSACGFLLCSDMFAFISDVANRYEEFMSESFPEQTAMRHIAQLPFYENRVVIHQRRTFNAVPVEVCPEAPEPWQPGDFCAHLTHVPVEERVRIFHEIRIQAPW